MTVKEALLRANEIGFPMAALAKRIGKDPSTINKWTRGLSRLSAQTEEDVKQEILKAKQQWAEIEIDEE